ncbi:MAG: PepSY domain-containing protein [Clostridium sp.]|nr:PepSY domain-containing protein [Clostridium sp.]
MANLEKLSDDSMEQVAGGTLTQEQALAKALEHSGVGQVDFLKQVELDYEHGRQVYEIKFYKNGLEYEYDIDAQTGAVLKFEKDFD